MLKIEFYIVCNQPNYTQSLRKVNGYTNGKYNYYYGRAYALKKKKYWIAVEPNCGLSCGQGETLGDAIKMADWQGHTEQHKQTDEYKQQCLKFQNMLEELKEG